jgi:hypothetical protein
VLVKCARIIKLRRKLSKESSAKETNLRDSAKDSPKAESTKELSKDMSSSSTKDVRKESSTSNDARKEPSSGGGKENSLSSSSKSDPTVDQFVEFLTLSHTFLTAIESNSGKQGYTLKPVCCFLPFSCYDSHHPDSLARSESIPGNVPFEQGQLASLRTLFF